MLAFKTQAVPEILLPEKSLGVHQGAQQMLIEIGVQIIHQSIAFILCYQHALQNLAHPTFIHLLSVQDNQFKNTAPPFCILIGYSGTQTARQHFKRNLWYLYLFPERLGRIIRQCSIDLSKSSTTPGIFLIITFTRIIIGNIHHFHHASTLHGYYCTIHSYTLMLCLLNAPLNEDRRCYFICRFYENPEHCDTLQHSVWPSF